MAKPQFEFHQPAEAWLAADMGIAGIWVQMLAEDAQTGNYTRLLRYEPGVDTSLLGVRRHCYWEEVYILSGDLTDLRIGTTFTAGMYACRPPGMPHGPWRTEQGVVMLEIRYGHIDQQERAPRPRRLPPRVDRQPDGIYVLPSPANRAAL